MMKPKVGKGKTPASPEETIASLEREIVQLSFQNQDLGEALLDLYAQINSVVKDSTHPQLDLSAARRLMLRVGFTDVILAQYPGRNPGRFFVFDERVVECEDAEANTLDDADPHELADLANRGWALLCAQS